MLSQKDYVAIAKIIADLRDRGFSATDEGIAVLESVESELADYFVLDNPRFSRGRFLQACGWTAQNKE